MDVETEMLGDGFSPGFFPPVLSEPEATVSRVSWGKGGTYIA